MCGPPKKYMLPPYEYVEYVESSSDTGTAEAEENHNTWNALLEVLTLPGSSPAIQQSLQDWGGMQIGIDVPLRAGRCPRAHGVVSRGAVETPKDT